MASLLAGATDSYLYWMVDVDEAGWDYDYSVRIKDTAGGSGDGSFLNLYYGDGSAAGTSLRREYLKDLGGSSLGNVGFYAKLASNMTYTSYVFELFCDSGTVAQSGPFEYADVKACIVTDGIGDPALSPLMVTMGPLPAPEPSSGLLLLLGVAGLALRRRKQIAA